MDKLTYRALAAVTLALFVVTSVVLPFEMDKVMYERSSRDNKGRLARHASERGGISLRGIATNQKVV